MTGFGVDVGGSGIKGAIVDLETGQLVGERHRVPTPDTSPKAILDVVASMPEHFGWEGPFGVAVPGVVNHGVIRSAINLAGDWRGLDIGAVLARTTGKPIHVLNDADAAGLAEITHGAAKGRAGVVMTLTFGTGIGSALFIDGVLIPNTEFGHLEIHGMKLEQYAAGRLIESADMDIAEWAKRANEVIAHLDFIFSPDLIVVGGGISTKFEEYKNEFSVETPIVPAALRNSAGIVGAAMVSAMGETR